MELATLKKINRPRPLSGSCTVKAMGRYKIKFTPQFSVTPKQSTIKIRFTVQRRNMRANSLCSFYALCSNSFSCHRLFQDTFLLSVALKTKERKHGKGGEETRTLLKDLTLSENFTATSILLHSETLFWIV